ncbi:hypothetical protein FOZ63_033579 [Perkinsus olseni]|uniref:Integrase catalytic domain-containing protein n=1 Tax=Perkinsus olseni TaxID=32597 RepID=A0A7J6UNS8_PEROL|nr:hypothetical protein FOZ62_031726 [Perkinsus olseni]KAF4758658.1 hypothetical protein FOZ63_033579 [Perkinsus olseni]
MNGGSPLAHEVLDEVLRTASSRGFEENEAKRISSDLINLQKRMSILGYLWDAQTDSLKIAVLQDKSNLHEVRRISDYRRFLATCFDPCGLYLEHMMKGRLTLQQLSQRGEDAELTHKEKESVETWFQAFKEDTTIPRTLYPINHSYDVLVAYIDASAQASAVILETIDGRRVWARGFIRPINEVRRTAPRMELDILCTASAILATFLSDVVDYWGIELLIICTDSEINLARLRRTPTAILTSDELVTQRRVVKTRNNLYEIRRKTGIRCSVCHIEGERNPADAPTRGKLRSEELEEDKGSYVRALQAQLIQAESCNIENLPNIYELPEDYQPIPIPASLTNNKPKKRAKFTEKDEEKSLDVSAIAISAPENSDDIVAIYHKSNLICRFFREWQHAVLDLGDEEHEQDVAISPLIYTIRDVQRLYSVDNLLKAPFTSLDGNDLVVRNCRQDVNGRVYTQLVIPPGYTTLQNILLRKVHGRSHHGINATYNEMVKRYHWPGMRRMVARMVLACGTCIRNRHRRTVTQGSVPKKFDRTPWSNVGLDHCGAYDNNGDKQKYLLVCTCLLTGYLDAEPVSSTNGLQLVTATRRLFARNGTPRRVCSDRGQAYMSSIFRLYMTSINVQHHCIPSMSPKYGGKYERSHGPLNDNLKLLKTTRPRTDWKTLVAEAVSAANGRPRWTTITAWDLMHSYPQDQSALYVPKSANLLEEWLEGQWEDDRERTREKIGDNMKKVNIGDYVYLNTPSPMKLGEVARGPYVVEAVRGQTYFLKELSTGKTMQQPLHKLIVTKTADIEEDVDP